MINKKTHGAQTEGKTKSLAGVTVTVMTTHSHNETQTVGSSAVMRKPKHYCIFSH